MPRGMLTWKPSWRAPPQFHEYLVVGRGLPTEKTPEPTIYRMRIFAPNALVARSKFWYFMKRLSDVKKMNGEILLCTEVGAPPPGCAGWVSSVRMRGR
jgi:hypothetical protein